jgi:hypothetical protein
MNFYYGQSLEKPSVFLGRLHLTLPFANIIPYLYPESNNFYKYICLRYDFKVVK